MGTTLDTPLTLIFLDRLSHHNFRWRQIRTHSVQSTVESSRRPGLRSADTADYIKRRTRTKFGERCFSHAGPAAWNSLPDSIRLTTDANRLKKSFKNSSDLITRGQSNLTKSASRGAYSPVRGHPRGSKVVPLNSWGRVSY